MTNQSGGASGGRVETPSTTAAQPTPKHQSKDAPSAEKLSQSWRPLLCLLRPPLLQIFKHRLPTSSSPATLAQQQRKARRNGHVEQQVGDSEGSERNIHSTPTPSSSQHTAAAKASATHATTGKRALNSDAEAGADEAARVHKKTETTGPSSSVGYKLVLVQEPTIGAAFEDNLLGRIGLAPPLILELQILKDGRPTELCEELPFLICQCSLLDEQGAIADMMDQSPATTAAAPQGAVETPSGLMPPTTPTARGRRGRKSSSSRRGSFTSASAVSGSRSSESTDAAASDETSATATPVSQPSSSGSEIPHLRRMLYGTIIASPQQYVPEGGEGVKPYFFFPEISVRMPGKFRIRCNLMRLTLPGLQASSETGVLASVDTETFQVVKRNRFTAPYITDISRHFARQGVPLLLPPGVSAD